MANPLYGQNKADSEIAKQSDVSAYQVEYTESAAIEITILINE